jgi:hypothetical protein
MPVTLPAHAAAILPLCRVGGGRWLPPSALVAGACAPDVAYLLGPISSLSHSWPGLVLFCLPAGLALWVWLEALVLPVLRRVLPAVGGVQWGRFLLTRGLPATPRGHVLAALAVLLGAATHVLWDGFTHPRSWPSTVLYPHVFVPLGRWNFPLARVLQHASSLVGSLVVLGVLARRYPRLPQAPGGRWHEALPVLLPTLLGALVGLTLRLARFQPQGFLEGQLHWAFWPTVRGALLGLSLGCLLARWRTHADETEEFQRVGKGR